VAYLYALAKGGVPLAEALRSLSRERGIYGEAAREAGYVLAQVDYRGKNLQSALRHSRATTPSEEYRAFVDGLVATLESGADAAAYLGAKLDYYHEAATESQRRYLEALAVMAEAYVTAFVAGPIFFIVMLLMLGFAGKVYIGLLEVLVYLVIPGATAGFIGVLRAMGAAAPEARDETSVRLLDRFPAPGPGPSAEGWVREHERWKRSRRLRRPWALFVEAPERVLLLSVPAAAAALVVAVWSQIPQMAALLGRYEYWARAVFPPPAVLAVDDALFFAVVGATLPYALFHEIRRRREVRVERDLPELLHRLAAAHQAGLTLAKTVGLVARAKLGVLRDEVGRLWNQVRWGVPVSEALLRFQRRTRSDALARSTTLLVAASRAAPDIHDVLQIAARDAEMGERLRRERAGNMFVYLAVVYVSFGVFLLIVSILNAVFLPVVPVPGLEGQAELVGPLVAKGTGKEMYKLLFFHAALIQGFFTGLVAGQMGEGRAAAGLKHGLAMSLIAYVAFAVMG
jgi:flagellar protein FlaJ